MDYQQKAKAAVLATVNIKTDHLDEEDLYVVWFAKTLQNWKALISTDVVAGRYWEVTYNGDKRETYVDDYRKHGNMCIHDQEEV